MHFIRRGPEERQSNNVDDADVVVQIGTAKTGLKAAHLVGANIRIPRSPGSEALQPSHTFPQATNTQGKALEALSQMQNALSTTTTQLGNEPWPYSPDDTYPSRPQPNFTADSTSLPCLHRELSDATLPVYYCDPGQHPYYISQQTSASAVRDMPLHRGAPTIFDNVAEPPPRLRFSDAPEVVEDSLPQQRKIHRFSTRTKTRSRALDLVNLFPQTKSPGTRFIPQLRLSRSPSTMADFSRPPSSDRKLRKSRTTADSTPVTLHSHSAARASNRAGRPFDEAVLDQHKTNVRRPPKGIKNWFDAYPDEDDEDDEDEDLVDEIIESEPQELPAGDVLPPAYTGPYRHMSRRMGDRSTNGHSTPHNSHHAPQQGVERAMEHARLNQTSRSSRSDSMQSSHIGSVYHSSHHRRTASNLGHESILSYSEDDDEAEEEEYYETDEGDDYEDEAQADRIRSKLPAIRDSIFDDRNIMVANASALDVVRVPKPTQLNGIRIHHNVASCHSSFRSSTSAQPTQRRDKPVPLPSHQEQPQSGPSVESAALRRLHGLSLESESTTETTETGSTGVMAETCTSGGSYVDTVNGSQDTLQMVAITEEERMLLQIMRQKRVEMQQMSFTEGYKLALNTEQQRSAKRSAGAEERALSHLHNKESKEQHRTSGLCGSTETPTQEDEMRRQLSAIRKEQVDERFRIERFLDMSGPAPLTSHPPDAPRGDRKPRAPSGEVLPATRYCPAVDTAPATTATDKSGYFSADDYDAESVRKRVKQFISTKGAPPPLDSNMRTMRRPVTRGTTTSISPSPVIEEDRADIPPLPPRSPERASGHMRQVSNFTVSTLGLRRSSSYTLDESKDRSPVSAFSGNHNTHQLDSPVLTPQQHVAHHHDMVLLPRRPEIPVRQSEQHKLKKSPSQPQLSMNHPSRASNCTYASSPFANLINAASRVSIQHQPTMSHIASQRHHPRTTSSTDLRASAYAGVHKIDIMNSRTAMGKQSTLPRLDTVEHMRDARASLVSITSAGEEVLSAWAELGGGQDCLQTKVRHRTP